MSDHHFSVEDAQTYGVEEAIMLHNFKFWIAKNKANRKHLHEGRTWTYNTATAFAELMPYWTEKQVRRVLESLEKQGVILTGDFNEDTRNRTKWFALANEANLPIRELHLPKREDATSQTGSSTCAGVEGSNIKQHIENTPLFPIPDSVAFQDQGEDQLLNPTSDQYKLPTPKQRKGSGRASMKEVIAFCVELGLPSKDGEVMFYDNEEKGWPKNWQMKIRKWKSAGWMLSQKQLPVNGIFQKPKAKLNPSPAERREQPSEPSQPSEFKRKIPLRESLIARREQE